LVKKPLSREWRRQAPLGAWYQVEYPHVPGTPVGYISKGPAGWTASDLDGEVIGPGRRTEDEAVRDVERHDNRRTAYSYHDDVGGTLSWHILLGASSGNWRNNWQDSDGRSWRDIVGQIARAFESIRTRKGGYVSGVNVKNDAMTVYFDYDKDIDPDDAFEDAERALEDKMNDLSDKQNAYEWVLHGSVAGEFRSNMEMTEGAIEAGFDTGRTARELHAAALEGVSRRKVVKMVNNVIHRAPLKGIHRDEYWRSVQALWKAFDKAGIPWSISKSEYQYDQLDTGRMPVRKVWRFEVPFTSERGRPGIVYGQVVAAGAGTVDFPMSAYDVTAYVS
jgi:hypothetical protein